MTAHNDYFLSMPEKAVVNQYKHTNKGQHAEAGCFHEPFEHRRLNHSGFIQ